jgi:hypothetical protein
VAAGLLEATHVLEPNGRREPPLGQPDLRFKRWVARLVVGCLPEPTSFSFARGPNAPNLRIVKTHYAAQSADECCPRRLA